MTELIAKPVLKNKYWIVESEGSKVGTIQAVEDGTIVYVHDQGREKFASIKLLTKAYNFTFAKLANTKTSEVKHQIYNFPIMGKAYNVLWDLKNKVPVFTKSNKSKSFFCAGYFLIEFSTGWEKVFCPKLITINRYKFFGPFDSADKAEQELDNLNG